MITRFEGRCEKTAALKDLMGHHNPLTPWKERLPRMIFVSGMGVALSAKADFAFLKNDLIPAISSMVISFMQVKCLWLMGKALWAKQIGRFQFSYG